ncbi:MAG TPA: NTP transferase domain-containing protein [Thermoanaerobaculia bacterium]|nr:NTP transferase domain-containing protein [Thermoanaerobaculia bacterium]
MKLAILAAGLGTRLRSETLGRPKTFLEVGGRSLFSRYLELAALLEAEPLVVTRPEFEEVFRRTGAGVLVEAAPVGMIETLSYLRGHVSGDFCWIAADMLFTDLAPLKELLAVHRAGGPILSFFYCRTDRFKAKVLLQETRPEIVVTRSPGYALSIPNFVVCSDRIFSYLDREPLEDFAQRAIAAGEPVLVREYTAPVFEIDRPADLDEARRYLSERGGA